MSRELDSNGDGADLDEVLADCMRRSDRGEQIDEAALIAAHPTLADGLREYFSQAVAVERFAAGATADFAQQVTPHSALEVRCPNCHAPMEVAVDTLLTDLTCSACGSHFSLIDQSKATRMAPSLSKMGRFDLIERLGVGGFGSVWKARDKELDRTVAIKIPRAGGMTPEEQEKFFREARAAAQLKHPNIVSVHEVGRDGDSVYIVSDFVRGVTLGDGLTGQQLTSREAAELCAKIADALHHAHEQGVVHRDLKPANVMIDLDGQPHLMDFGLARRMAGEVTLTLDGQVIGTPAYMSPEQALGEAHTADRRSDVYSLGVILFQLLSGELPFRGNARMLIKQVAHDEPPSPRKFNSKIPKDLETITLKCMEKEPAKRYQTARDLYDELSRFLAGEPIHARPIGQLRYTWRWIRRHPVVVMSAAYFCLIPIFATITLAYFQVTAARDTAVQQKNIAVAAKEEEERQKELAVAAKEEESRQKAIAVKQERLALMAKQSEEYEAYVAQIGLAAAKINENAYDFARELLNQSKPALRNWEWGRLVHLCRLGAGSYQTGGPVQAVAYSPDGQLFVSADMTGKVMVRDAKTGEVRFEASHGDFVLSIAYSPDGKRIASGSSDNTIKILDASDGRELQALTGHTDGVLTVRFSPDGHQLLSGSYDKTARLWDLATAKVIQEFKGHTWWVWAAEFSPDAARIVTAGQDGKAIVWQKEPGARSEESVEQTRSLLPGARSSYARLTEFTGHEEAIYSAHFSPKGDLVATGGYDKLVMIWNPDELAPLDIQRRLAGQPDRKPNYLRLSGHVGPVRSVSFSPNGQLVVSGSQDNSIRLWEVATGKDVKVLRGHGSGVRSCEFSPDGNWVISGGEDEQVRLWDVEGYQEARVLHATVFAGHEDAVLSARYSRDGRKIVTAGRDRTAALWDATTGQPLLRFEEGHEFLVSNAVFFPDGQRVATGAGDNSVRIWGRATGTQLTMLTPTGRIGTLAVSPDNAWVATGSVGNDIQIWDARSGKLAATLRGHLAEVSALAFSLAGRLASGDERGGVRLWTPGAENDQWTFERDLSGHNGSIAAIRFAPDGQRLVTASADRTCGQWDLATGEELRQLVLKHPEWVNSLDISHDGALALTTCDDGNARAWRLADAAQLAAVQSPGKPFNAAGFSPDGSTAVLTSAEDKQVRLWDISQIVKSANQGAADDKVNGAGDPLGEPFLDFNRIGGEVWSAMFAPDGRHVLTIGGNDAQLWHLDSGKPVVRYSPHGAVASADVSPDGQLIATGSWDHSAKLWDATTGRAIRKLEGGHAGYINSVEFSPDGRELLTASDDFTARLWDVQSGKPVGEGFRGHAARLLGATYSPDGTRLLTVSGDKTAQIWDRASGQSLVKLEGHLWAVLCGQFSADGERVITGSQDKTARIWNANTGEKLIQLEGHTAAITSVAFSPDGTRALTGSQDNTAKLWDAHTGKEILSLPGHQQEVTSVSFSPDGRNVLTSSRDGTAIIWLAADWRGENVAGTLRVSSPTQSRTVIPEKREGSRDVTTSAASSTNELPSRPAANVNEPQNRQPDSPPPPATPAARRGPATPVRDAPTQSLAPYQFEGVVRAHEHARELKAVLARIRKDKGAEISAHEEFRDLCAKHVDRVHQLYETGRRGGEANYEALARCRFHRADAELAALRGQRDSEQQALNLAQQASEDWLNSTQAAYDTDKVTIEALIEAADGLTSLRIRQAELDNNEEKKIAALRAKVEFLTDLWRKVFALYEVNRRGGESEKEALVRARLLETATELAELHGSSTKPVNTGKLGFTAGKLPPGVKSPTMMVLEFDGLTLAAGRDVLRAVQAAYEADKAPLELLLGTQVLLARLKAAHAKRIGDEVAAVNALLNGRNACLDTWRRIYALYEVGRRGGEAEKEAYARAQYFEAQAKLLETIGEDEKSWQKYGDLSLPAGELPDDWAIVEEELGRIPRSRGPAEQTYRNGLHAVEDLIAAATTAAENGKLPNWYGDAMSVARYLELAVVSPDGQEIERYWLRDEALLDLRGLFATLPDNHYKVFLVRADNSSRRLIIELYVRRGRIIDPSDDSEGSRDRPPTSEAPHQIETVSKDDNPWLRRPRILEWILRGAMGHAAPSVLSILLDSNYG